MEQYSDAGIAQCVHLEEALAQEAGVGTGDVIDVAGVDHPFAEAGGWVAGEIFVGGDGGLAGGGKAGEPVGGMESRGEDLFCEALGEAGLGTVADGERGGTGQMNFSRAADPCDAGGETGVDRCGV